MSNLPIEYDVRITLVNPPKLTRRHREILVRVAADMTNKEIGRELGITVPTVKNHISNMMLRTGASTRIGLVTRHLITGELQINARERPT